MLKRIKYYIIFILKNLFFWIVFFLFARLLFILIHINSNTISFKDKLLSFYYGFKLDLSSAAYLTSIIAIIFLFQNLFFKFKIVFEKIIFFLTYSFIVLLSILVISDIHLYHFWGFRINKNAIAYLINPQEAFASVSIRNILLDILAIVFLSFIFIKFYNIFFKKDFREKISQSFASVFIDFILTFLLIIPIRGGIGLAPLSISVAYFSNNNLLNHSALNVLWNFIYSYTITNADKNPYEYFSIKECKSIINEFDNKYINNDTTKINLTKNPNIIIIICESFTTKVIEQRYNNIEITPYFNKLKNEGIYFENFYSNGNRTDKGLIAIINSLPTYGNFSQMTMPEKFSKLSSLPKILRIHGYTNYFYYGGDINFFRMKAYLLECGYDSIVSEKNITSKTKKSKWGYPDHVLFEKINEDINNFKTPFLLTILTLSNHDPYDIPVKYKFGNNDDVQKFLSSINYADSCLGSFINNFKRNKLWNNTIVIITGDHGSRMPELSDYHLPQNYKIPMLWIGGNINNNIKLKNYANQIDICPTLLTSMNLSYNVNDFYGNNIFNKSFAFYTFYEGFTFINDSIVIIYNDKTHKIANSDLELNYTKAILQLSYYQFTRY